MIAIDQNIADVRARIKQATTLYSRESSTIALLAVSKKQPVSAIQVAIAAGINDFGENYLQEAEAKISEIREKSLNWHYIGSIQSNKTRSIAELFDWVHSVDRVSIAQRLSRQRPESLAPLNICLQVNIDAEASKSGLLPAEVLDAVSQISAMPNLRLRGLMAIPAKSTDVEATRASFARMNTLFKQAQQCINCSSFDSLSMGMSADIEPAIAEGATLLRVGTDIFGARSS
jgi:pyridoxal phosphate enzyme (YggS family)